MMLYAAAIFVVYALVGLLAWALCRAAACGDVMCDADWERERLEALNRAAARRTP